MRNPMNAKAGRRRRSPNTFEQTGVARSQIGLPHPPDVTAMLAISMICFGHHDGFPRKIVCRQIRGQFDCLVSSIRVQKIQLVPTFPSFIKSNIPYNRVDVARGQDCRQFYFDVRDEFISFKEFLILIFHFYSTSCAIIRW